MCMQQHHYFKKLSQDYFDSTIVTVKDFVLLSMDTVNCENYSLVSMHVNGS